MKHFTFDRVLNVALLAAVVYGIAAVRPGSRTPPPTYAHGEQAPAIAGVSYAGAKRTAVLFVRSSCHFCTESMPFYRDLVKGGGRLIAIGPEPPEALLGYLEEHDLAVRGVTIGRGSWPKLTGTPTLIIVDGSGRVERTWVGTVPENEQSIVRELLQ